MVGPAAWAAALGMSACMPWGDGPCEELCEERGTPRGCANAEGSRLDGTMGLATHRDVRRCRRVETATGGVAVFGREARCSDRCGHPTPQTIAGHHRLEDLGGLSLASASNLRVEDTEALRNVAALALVEWHGEDFEFTGNAALEVIGPLQMPAEVRRLWIVANPRLRALELEPPARAHSVYVSDNVALQSIDELSGLRDVEHLSVVNAPELTSVAALAGLESIHSLELGALPSVADLPALAGLEPSRLELAGFSFADLGSLPVSEALVELWLVDNDDLRSLAGAEVAQDLELLSITGSATLESLEGLAALEGLDRLLLGSNPALQSLTGLEALASVNAILSIRGCDALADLHPLDQLTEVGDNLVIESNEGLRSLDGLGSLTRVGGSLVLESLPALSDLSGLQSLTEIGNHLYITDVSAELKPEVDALLARVSVGTGSTICYAEPGERSCPPAP